MNIDCYIAIFSFTNISSRRWVFRRENTKLLLSKLCRLCDFRHLTLKQAEFLSQSICAQIMSNLRCIEEMYLIIIEITYGICLSKGCVCIIAAITDRVTDWRNWKYTKSLFFPPVVWAKSRKRDEHVTFCTTKNHYLFCLPRNGRIVSMILGCFWKEIFYTIINLKLRLGDYNKRSE